MCEACELFWFISCPMLLHKDYWSKYRMGQFRVRGIG
jgi:hypothetical protein